MTERHFYFPYAAFKRYTATKIHLDDEKTVVKALAEFNQRSVGEEFDRLLRPRLLFADAIGWYRLRNALIGKVLGRDIILEFKGGELDISDLLAGDNTTLILSVSNVRPDELRIKDHVVASRILATDMLLKLFYDRIYPSLKDTLRDLRAMEASLPSLMPKAKRIVEQKLWPSSLPSRGQRQVRIYLPDVLDGFIASMFPFLGRNAIFSLAINHYIGAGYAEEFGLKPSDPDKFNAELDEAIEEYKAHLDAFARSLEGALTGEEVQDKVLSLIPTGGEVSLLELMMKAKKADVSEVTFFATLSTLIRLNKVVVAGEKIRRVC